MVVPGALNDLAQSLQVSVAARRPADRDRRRGRCASARRCSPAGSSGFDRRRLLALLARSGTPSATRSARADAELRRAAAAARHHHARRRRVHAAGRPRRSASWRRPSSAAARSPSSSSAGRWPRCSACRWRPGSARPSAGAARSRAIAVLSLVGRGLGLRASCPTASARRRCRWRAWKEAFDAPGADGDRRRHRAVRRRPVHAVLLLRALLPRRRCTRPTDAVEPAVRLVRRLRPDRQRARCRASSTASAPHARGRRRWSA